MLRKLNMVLVLIISVLLLGGCSININGDKVDLNGSISVTSGTTLSEKDSLVQNADGINTLEIRNNAGNIDITRGESANLSIEFEKKVKGSNEEVKKDIMKNIKISIDKNGDKFVLTAKTRDNGGSYLWDWVENLYKGVNVSIDYKIQVPDNIKVYVVNNNAGNIGFDSVSGEITADQNAGNITVRGVSLEGKSSFKTNAGNIDLGIEIDRALEVNAGSAAGNIMLTLPGQSKFSLESRLTAGNLSGSFLSGTRVNSGTVKQEFNGGGTKVLVTLTAGNVTINKK